MTWIIATFGPFGLPLIAGAAALSIVLLIAYATMGRPR